MRKIALLFITVLCINVCFAQVNDADKNAALQLVSANRAALSLSADDLNNLMVSSSYQDISTGIRYVYLQQTYKNIPVYNQIQVITFRNDKVLSVAGDRIAGIVQKVNVAGGIPTVSADSAVMSAILDRDLTSIQRAVAINTKDNGRFIEFGNMGVSRENITAQLMWVPDDRGKFLNLAWQVYIIPVTTSDYWLVRINATNGNTLGVDNLTVYCNWDDPHHIFEFGKNHNYVNEIAKSGFGKNLLFDFRASLKTDFICLTSPLIPLQRRGKGRFLEMPFNTISKINKKTSVPLPLPLADNVDYRVIPYPYEAPTFMPGPSTTWHAIRSNPWTSGSANATTLKWHSTAVGTDYNYTRGNNVWAYHDQAANNTAGVANSASSTTALPNLTFDFTPDYTLEPTVTTPPNQQFNITNLFYWNNIIHNVMYNYGFDEVGGNFQNNNLSRGGIGNDHVRAEAQDGGGTNNANFSTPADGSPPRMQMYLWTAPTPDRDGDVDNGIIVHEYGHGISNRLTGGPATASCLGNAEQMGEGWSDYYALMLTQDWATANLNTGFTNPRGIGTYALNQATSGAGIRTQRYCTDFTVNNRVYAATISTSVHNIGEIWCATLWDMTWNIIQQTGTINPNIYNLAGGGGNNIALKLVTEAMKLQPCSPGFISGRDAIIQADINLYGGAHLCAIKEAFRRRGMGDGASQGSSGSVTDQVPSFVGGGATLTLLQNGVISTPEGQNINYTNRLVVGNCNPLVNFIITDTLPTNVSFISANNGGTYNAGNRVVSWTVNQSTGTTVDYNFVVNINTGAYYPTVTLLNETVAGATIPASWTTTATPTANLWTVSSVQSKSAPNSFFTSNLTTTNDQILATTSSLALPANPTTFSFWGYINSETSWDGGVVEISTNGGSTWTDLGPYMTSGGYNGSLGSSPNPLSGRQAFTGNSSGFVKTAIYLNPYINQANVKFRFRFGSDASVAAAGWWVDDILLQDIAHVYMRSNFFNASLVRLQYADSIMVITAPIGCTAGTVSGTSPLCISNTATYTTNGAAGGSWSSTDTLVATVNSSSGLVTAVSAGTTNITYTVTIGCVSPVSSFKTLTVSPNVIAGTVSGTSPLCIGNTATYTSSGTSGGSWSSTNSSVATVVAGTGLVTTLAAGTTNITYTLSSGCGSPVSSFKTLTVSNISAGTVSGASPLCISATATYTSNGTSGGTWTSTDTLVATVNSTTGLVTAVNAGTTNITYTVSSGCSIPVSSFKTLTVDPTVNAGTVSGISPLCIGNTTTYTSNGTSGGSWSSTAPAVATVVAGTGLVTTLAAGTTNITYSVSSGCGSPVSSFQTLTVSNISAGTVSGTSPLCIGNTATYTSNGTSGGSWSSANTSVATVNSSTGLVTAISSGATNITYTVSSGCGIPVSSFKTLTINPTVTAGTVSGTSPLCIGATATYTSSGTVGGSWSSANTSVATVNSSTGLVTAVSSGTTNITYTINSGCGSPVSAFKTLTVNPNANAGTVNGTSPLCISATATYTSSGTVGGSWSSTAPAVATVNSLTGLVTPISAGTTNITYTISTGCGSPVSAFKTLTVDPNVNAGTVSGTSSLCIGATATYTSNGTVGGSWSSSDIGIATVNASTGMVTAVNVGITNITYTISSGCGSPVSAFKTLTVDPSILAGVVSGTSPLCIGATTIYLSSGTAGGAWSSSNTSAATVNSSTGLVTAVNAGTTNITYTVSTGCGSPVSASKTLTVPSVCELPLMRGSVRRNTDPAKIDVVFKPLYTSIPGEYIYYLQFAVSIPASFPGAGSMTATMDVANNFTGVGPFNVIAPYTETFGTPDPADDEQVFGWFCGASSPPLSWTAGNAFTGVVVTFSTSVAATQVKMLDLGTAEGGINSNTYYSIFTSPTGELVDYANMFYLIPGVSQLGTYPVSGDQWVQTTSCNGAVGGTASGSTTFCISGTPAITASGYSIGIGSGYQWEYSNDNFVSNINDFIGQTNPAVLTTGVVSATTYYRLRVSCSSGNSTAWSNIVTVTVNPNVTAGTVSGTSPLSIGATATYTSNGTAGGSWSSTNTSVATVNSSTGLVTTVAAGTTNITYTISSGCGSPVSASKTLTVSLVINDDAPGAILLTVGSGCTGSPFTNVDATQSIGEPFAACKGTAGYKTVWYKFLAPASGNVKVSTDYSGGTMGSDSRVALFSAEDENNYASFTNRACDDDNGYAVADRSVLYATGLTPGSTYYIQVDGKDGSTATGTFCLTVDELASSMLATSTACAAGQPLTSVNDNYTGWLSATDASGNLIALINNPSGGATTSTYDNALNIHAGPVRQDAVSLQYYLDRNYLINNTNPANVNMNVQFFFLNTELTALQAADPGVTTLATLQATRQTGTVCDNDFIAANGTNSSIAQSSNVAATGFSRIQITTPGFSKFYLHTKKAVVPVKTILQGAYSSGTSMKAVTAAWAGVLNTHALNQPYNTAPFNYTGTESVSAGFFTSTGSLTNIVDWVLLELRNAATPATVVSSRAALIRRDGRIVDLNGTSDVSWKSVANGNYFLAIRHRNHLGIRSAATMTVNGALSFAALALYDFSTAQSQAFQDGLIITHEAMKNFGAGVFGMWGGNGNANNTTRAGGGVSVNDYLYLTATVLGNNPLLTLNNVYSRGDFNMDGTARAGGGVSVNDYLFLVATVLSNDPGKIITQHQ